MRTAIEALNIATRRIGDGTIPIACEQLWHRSVNVALSPLTCTAVLTESGASCA